jgi:hypothetical protein
MAFLIADGFTLNGLIPARAGLHGPGNVTYPPAHPERVMEYLKGDESTPQKELTNWLKLLKEHLVSWDVEDKDGQVATISDACLRRVPHPALRVLLDHVTGYKATDWNELEKN